jgi:hypothetical protein
MDKDVLQIVIAAIVFAYAGMRIYSKYLRKSNKKTDNQKLTGTSSKSSSKDDDYEPYLKK